MYRTGHIGINLLGYSPIMLILIAIDQMALAILGLLFIANFASLPDLDLNYWFLAHRGFTHTYSFAFIIGLITGLISIPLVLVAVYFGFVSTFLQVFLLILGSALMGVYAVALHLVGDVITPSGIRPFKKPPYVPNSSIFSEKRYTFDICKAANDMANFSFLVLGISANLLATYIGLMF